MKKLNWALLAALFLAELANASSTTIKQADTISNSSGGAAIAVPSVGANFVTDTATQTLTNKSISGATNTLSAIPATAISSGQLGVANGGTGAASFSTNSVVTGNGTSALSGIQGTQYQLLEAGVSGAPVFGAVNLNQSAAVSGQLGVANGGTGLATLTSGGVVIGAGTSTPTFVTCSTSGYSLQWNGSSWACASQSGMSPNISGTYASPTSVTAAGGVTVSGLSSTGLNYAFVSGSVANTTVTATPSVAGCSSAATAGTTVTIVGGTNAITLQDSTNLASSGLTLNGNWTSAAGKSLTLMCASATGPWIEVSRSN